MPDWKKPFLHISTRLERVIDRTLWKVRQARGLGPVTILPYIGYGTADAIHVRGRGVERPRVMPSRAADSPLRNFVNTVQRFNSQDLPHVRVQARFGGHTQVITATVEGHFSVEIPLDEHPPEVWHEVALSLPDYADDPGATAAAPVMIPPVDAQFGVVSDLDDSVIRSDVANKARLLANTFLRNALTRQTFPGLPEWYRALQVGTAATFNPIFYVSSSPWNLHDMLVEFLQHNDIPLGPLFLLDLGLTEQHFIRPDPRDHKRDVIRRILHHYPHLPFVLKGDNSEEDPEAFVDVMREFPGRVLTAYIRDVRAEARTRRMQRAVDETAAAGSEMVLFETTGAAARHAAERGYILPAAADVVQRASQT